MKLPLFIAIRYLFARKSHNVINVISAISAAGMAIGTAALILILSIYNGLDSVVRSGMGRMEPDLLIEPSVGKTMPFSDSLLARLSAFDGVASVEPVLDETVFADYEGVQSVARIKGVYERYFKSVYMEDCIVEGTLALRKGSLDLTVLGRGIASSLGASPRFLSGIDLFFPRTDREISLTDPLSSLNTARLFPSAVVSVNNVFDPQYIMMSFDAASRLLGMSGDECSALELRLDTASTGPYGSRGYKKAISQIGVQVSGILGDGFDVKTREQQNETLYRMLRAEKVMIFVILSFVIIVIAFNIFGSLSMLIMEKSDDIGTFTALGAREKTVKRIFVFEGWLISLLGLAAGLVIGCALALLQQHFGLIKMPGNYIVTAYPAILEVSDIVVSAVCIGLVGYAVALLPVRSFFKKLFEKND